MNVCFLLQFAAAAVRRIGARLGMLCILLGTTGGVLQAAEEPLELLEQRAFRTVLEHVTPTVVRIETIGGVEDRQGVLLPGGAATGTIVAPEGLIITSVLPFLSKPSAVVVRLADGTRLPATPVATDHSRLLVLLRVKAERPLPVLPLVPEKEIRPGMWAIAIGWGYEADTPGVAAGVVSATGRLWGKALQTDAGVSPANYGGPLVDIRGRLLGVVVPLSSSGSVLAGVEWYDSGIGFAVPGEHLQRVLPRLARGEDLYPGTLGLRFSRGNPVLGEPVVAEVIPGSPADRAGLKAGDRIVAVDQQPVERTAQVFQAIGTQYAGDDVSIAVRRNGKRIEEKLTLVSPQALKRARGEKPQAQRDSKPTEVSDR